MLLALFYIHNIDMFVTKLKSFTRMKSLVILLLRNISSIAQFKTYARIKSLLILHNVMQT